VQLQEVTEEQQADAPHPLPLLCFFGVGGLQRTDHSPWGDVKDAKMPGAEEEENRSEGNEDLT